MLDLGWMEGEKVFLCLSCLKCFWVSLFLCFFDSMFELYPIVFLFRRCWSIHLQHQLFSY